MTENSAQEKQKQFTQEDELEFCAAKVFNYVSDGVFKSFVQIDVNQLVIEANFAARDLRDLKAQLKSERNNLCSTCGRSATDPKSWICSNSHHHDFWTAVFAERQSQNLTSMYVELLKSRGLSYDT